MLASDNHEAVVQLAYVVSDLDEAILHWATSAGAGPFFRMTVTVPDGNYRGSVFGLRYEAAFAFLGDMNIELIEQTDGTPSVYREMLDDKGPGFHHFMVRTNNIEATLARYARIGIDAAFRAELPGSGPWAYLDGRAQLGSYVELYEMRPSVEEMWSRMKAAHLDWDGSRPMRDMAELP